MRTLDCENVATTYASLEAILGLTRLELETILTRLDVNAFYEQNPRYPYPADEYVYDQVLSTRLTKVAYEQTCWFHLTRIRKIDSTGQSFFEKGIRPLGEQLDTIWNDLYEITSKHQYSLTSEQWNSFRTTLAPIHSAWLYRLKVDDTLHWGPYAMLVRDSAFRAEEAGNHDYLRAPEIIEDICECFKYKFGLDLLKLYAQETRPCIVKFVEDSAPLYALKAALYYLYTMTHQEEFSINTNCSFDAEAISIKKTRVLKVEIL